MPTTSFPLFIVQYLLSIKNKINIFYVYTYKDELKIITYGLQFFIPN